MRNGQRGRTGPPRWTPGQGPPEVVLVGATERLQDEVARITAAAGIVLRLADGAPQPGPAADGATLLLAGGAAGGVPGACGDVIVVGFAAESARPWGAAAPFGPPRRAGGARGP